MVSPPARRSGAAVSLNFGETGQKVPPLIWISGWGKAHDMDHCIVICVSILSDERHCLVTISDLESDSIVNKRGMDIGRQ